MSMEINGVVGGILNLEAGTEVAQLTPRMAHSELAGRDEPGQHSIDAISDLRGMLGRAGNNLLHNAEFEYGLVNQRNHSGAVSNSYCFDGWIGDGNLRVGEIGVSGIGGETGTAVDLGGSSMSQVIQIPPNALVGQALTLTADILGRKNDPPQVTLTVPDVGGESKGTITDNRNRPAAEVSIANVAKTVTIAGQSCSSVLVFKIKGVGTCMLQRLFLEVGETSHMTDTLPVEYEQKLLACYRNLIRYGGTVLNYPAFAIAQNANQATMILHLPTAMRTDGGNVNATIEGEPVLRLGATDVAEISGFTQVRNVGGNALHATFNVTGGTLTAGTVYLVRLTTGAYLTFSTEIMP